MRPVTQKSLTSAGFEKSQDPQIAAVEYAKSRAAREVALASGNFIVPEILDYDPKRGHLLFEYLPDLVPLQVVFCLPDQATTVAEKAGRVLSILHEQMTLPHDLVIPLQSELAFGASMQGWLHGDFNLHNVCLQRSSQSLVVLDWSMTQLLGGRATYGTRYFDPAWFIYNTFSHSGIRWPSVVYANECAEAFMRGYLESMSGQSKDAARGQFTIYLQRVVKEFQNMRKAHLGRLLYWAEAMCFQKMEKWNAKFALIENT